MTVTAYHIFKLILSILRLVPGILLKGTFFSWGMGLVGGGNVQGALCLCSGSRLGCHINIEETWTIDI